MILIVGGAGYIGSHVNKMLNGRGYKTVVFDNLSRGHRELVTCGEFFQGDLANKADLAGCFERYPITAVMHFSAFTYVNESVMNPSLYYSNNVSNTLNLLDEMIKRSVRRFVFSSTCATYGMPLRVPMGEDHPQSPINPYGHSKLMIEQILRDYDKAYGIRHVILRYFNAAGADPEGELGEWHEPETHLIPLTIRAAMETGGVINVFGADYPTEDGTCVRDYIHVLDIADAHILAMERLDMTDASDVYNLGNGQGHSIKRVIESVGRVSGKEVPVVYSGRREGDAPILISDSAKALAVLKWQPKYADLDTIIETAWRWHVRHAVS